jgi:hypothetical protein
MKLKETSRLSLALSGTVFKKRYIIKPPSLQIVRIRPFKTTSFDIASSSRNVPILLMNKIKPPSFALFSVAVCSAKYPMLVGIPIPNATPESSDINRILGALVNGTHIRTSDEITPSIIQHRKKAFLGILSLNITPMTAEKTDPIK